jgi:hypothetical protein
VSSLNLRPTQLPECRDDLAGFLPTPIALQYLKRLCGPLARSEYMEGDARVSPESLRKMQVSGLRAAALFHVSEAMTNLAVAAATTLPHSDLADFDLPAAAGFIYFAKPIATFTGAGGQVPAHIRACLWEQQLVPGGGIVWMSFYSDWYAWLEESAARGDFNGGVFSECIVRDHPLYLENYLGEPLIIADDMPPLSDTERGRRRASYLPPAACCALRGCCSSSH